MSCATFLEFTAKEDISMLQNAKELQGYTIRTRDGDIGSVYAFYFDDAEWCIRYIVVDTTTWWSNRRVLFSRTAMELNKRVLISPTAVELADIKQRILSVDLTQQQVQDSPNIDAEKPVSRQQEIALHTHYNWPAYWTMLDPIVAQALVARPGGSPVLPPSAAPLEPLPAGDPHLRSSRAVTGYAVQASDGCIGHVEDVIIDNDTWHIRYIMVDTQNWLPGRKVLISPMSIREVNWTDSQVHVEMTQEQISDSPEWDPESALNHEYEAQLHDHSDRLISHI